jgi:hypothetical protein
VRRSRVLRTAFPDLRITIEDLLLGDLVVDEDKVVMRYRGQGTHPGYVLGALRVDAGPMDSTRARTTAGPVISKGIVLVGFQTGWVPRAYPQPYPQPCHERAVSVPGRGKRDGSPSSAPQVSPSDRSDSAPHLVGTPLERFSVGPAAHRSNPSLRLLLYCCWTGPSWTVS